MKVTMLADWLTNGLQVSYIKEQMSLIRKNIHAIEDCYNEQMWNSDDVGSSKCNVSNMIPPLPNSL